jgi:DNA-binding Xre family transcriptional regulator
MQGATMPIRSNLGVLMARKNLERAQAGETPLNWHTVAQGAGVTHSALLKLVRGESERIDFKTIDRLMEFFGTENLNDILVRVKAE